MPNSNQDTAIDHDTTNNVEPINIFDSMMLRGERLRQLRLLAEADEEARRLEQMKQKQRRMRKNTTNKNFAKNITMTNDATTTMNEQVITHDSMDLVVEKTKYKRNSTTTLPSLSSVTTLTDSTYNGGCSSNTSTNSGIIENNNDDIVVDDNILQAQVDLDYFNIDAGTEEGSDNNDINDEEDEFEDKIDFLPDSKLKVLRYDTYLKHQRYNDDYKHADCQFIDFGYVDKHFYKHSISNEDGSKRRNSSSHQQSNEKNGHRLMIEQQKALGKGGFVSDAGVVLADHLIAMGHEWTTMNKTTTSTVPKMVELGAGTGVTGLMIAKAIKSHVYITDLPDVMRLMERNVRRNFHNQCIQTSTSYDVLTDEDLTNMDRGIAAKEVPSIQNVSSPEVTLDLSMSDIDVLYCDDNKVNEHDRNSTVTSMMDLKQAEGIVTAKVLRWGIQEDYKDGPFDVVIAGDVVTTLYDPSALAKTIYDLCHEHSIVYICVKRRLNACHENFEKAMNDLFASVSFATPVTRHRNLKEISIMRATGRRRKTL